MRIEVAGENACIIYFGDIATPALTKRIHALAKKIKAELATDVVDLIPSYVSLYIELEIEQTNFEKFTKQVTSLIETADPDDLTTRADGKLVTLPVYYGNDVGPDLDVIAKATDLTTAEVIALHTGVRYQVYAIGFAPGFAYLGDVDERLATPRLATPRKHVAKGSVGIADRQTAVYPSDSPGGWNIIGRCPLPMFELNKAPPMRFSIGDRVCFEAITREAFIAAGGEL